MSLTIRARFRNGRLEPEEELNLAEGQEVTLTILDVPASKPDKNALRRAAGAWKGLVDADALIRDIYNDRLLSTRREPKL